MNFSFDSHRTVGWTRREWMQTAAGLTAIGLFGRTGFSQPTVAGVQKQLVVHTKVPHNAETALADLVSDWLTPVERFFVRSHAPVPEIDLATFRVTVEGLVEQPLELSIAELQEMPQSGTVATLTCAGNRRAEFNAIREVRGVQWKEGAIGNAQWGGVRLTDILNRACVKAGARHVWFESIDQVAEGDETFGFGGSIPIERALSDHDGVPGALVTLRMNDEPLAPDHGYPVRMVVPGYVGARSVKWLGRIIVSDQPSPNHYLAGAYHVVTEDTPLAWVETAPIYTFPINSVICDPAAESSLRMGQATVRGYALPPGNGRTIAKVEVSGDGGRSWQAANITGQNIPYCWVLWQAAVPLTGESSQLVVRATDSEGLMQPQTVPWNLKGYLYNAWHHVPVSVRS